MNTTLIVGPAPHIKSNLNTSRVMTEVSLALLPVVMASIYFFSWRAISLILSCVICCVASEALFQRLRGVRITISDGSAVVTGILLALVLPPGIPLWVACIGAVASIVLAKQLFGGLGCNIFNPALIGRAFLTASFPLIMTHWIEPFTLDAVTSATPLGLMKFSGVETNLKALFLGNVSGCLGETSALAILIGGLYLVIRRHADWRIVLSYVGTIFVFSLIAWHISPKLGSPLFHLLAGGIMLGAFFMLSDPVTTPLTGRGRFIFGTGAGIIVMVIRLFGGLPEGVMYSILLMNAVTPLINRYTIPKPFGGSAK